jgi:hypothetical protein
MSNTKIDLGIGLGLEKVELLHDDHVGNNVVSIFGLGVHKFVSFGKSCKTHSN